MVLFCRLQEGGRQAAVVTVLIELTECVVFSHDKDGAGSRLESVTVKGMLSCIHTIVQQKEYACNVKTLLKSAENTTRTQS